MKTAIAVLIAAIVSLLIGIQIGQNISQEHSSTTYTFPDTYMEPDSIFYNGEWHRIGETEGIFKDLSPINRRQ